MNSQKFGLVNLIKNAKQGARRARHQTKARQLDSQHKNNNMNLNINAVKEHAKTALIHLKDPWTLSWTVSGLLAITIPVITWSVQKGSYYNAYGYANEQEEQQRQYYENQDANDDGNNNNNNNYYSTYKECSWFNWPCRKRQYYYATMDSGDGDNEDGNGSQVLPNWYLFLGGLEQSEEMSQWKEENTGVRNASTGPSAGIEFVYVSTLLLFTALFAYGAMTIAKKQSTSNLVVFLVVAASISLMNLVGSAQGLVSSDDRDMEDSYYGWYGQMGVLIVYTNFWIMLFSIGYLIAFRVRSYLKQKADQNGDITDEEASKYQNYNAPKVEMS